MFGTKFLEKAATSAIRVTRSRKPLKFNSTKQALTFTPAAMNQLKAMAAEEGNSCFRIGLRTKGCNGMAYTLDYDTLDSKRRIDESVEKEGITILIDTRAQMSLLGTEMDYNSDRLAEGFVFKNPNITGTCGCGESFSL
jgi:iron-sulfur cluster assembly accessory protein